MMTRKRIAAEYIALGIACAVFATIVSIWIQDTRYVPSPNIHWRPWQDLFSIAISLPVALIVHALLPTGWIFWCGFAFALKRRNRWLYFASGVPSLVAGWLWPMGFWGLMSV